MNKAKENLIIFDLGWTLEDEQYSQIDRAKKASNCCMKYGIDIKPDKILELQDEAGRRGISNVFKSALSSIGLNNEQMNEVYLYAKWDDSFLQIYPVVKTTLAFLSQKNDLGIIANQSKPVTTRLINYDILHYFKFIIASCDVGIEKPDPRIFHLANPYHDHQKNIWMIGDRIDNDIIPAKRLGWKTIRIRKGSHRLQEAKDINEMPDFTIMNIDELLKIF